ncbi:dihydrofolate reductase family protein [Blastococcus goldschmidtiae]|uniref:Dihydrofolate reductase family protein n=1 Tax=Blastococcus goldschmidtiae TaxID=3075546 RepID=A0ABU2K4X5_9ACTN|nr:dihydrofolate reductase family protein [Blastococcus sp. DSM 46792]MDT0275222.1 dihydrofolate reductase family protein [Blastococcus sp. DSM 46792]
MGRIVVSENVSIDGVVQDPTGEEGFDRGGWFGRITDQARRAWAEMELQEARDAAALLLGGGSYTWFASRWPGRTGEWADRLNGLPKYVVSSTITAPSWAGTTVLSGDVPEAVSALKRSVDGDTVVHASRQLVHTLLDHGLVDELRLMVYPAVLGDGDRLFGRTGHRTPMRLQSVATVGGSLVHLVYRTEQDCGSSGS